VWSNVCVCVAWCNVELIPGKRASTGRTLLGVEVYLSRMSREFLEVLLQ
jgi:hypothetical protein